MRESYRRSALILLFVLGSLAVAPKPLERAAAEPNSTAHRYFIRVSECDDGGRAFVNGTEVVEVGFNESSDWLEVTPDLRTGRNYLRFQVMNRTGAITYHFQIKRNDEMIYDQSCGTVAVRGCEENRAFRIGVAREFVFRIDSKGSR